MKLLVRAALLAMLSITAAPAQNTAAPPPIQDWSNTETVVIDAPKGPALWRVSQNASEVWILPTIGPMPKDLEWNKAAVADAIKGANAVYLPPQASAGAFDFAGLLFTGFRKLKQPGDETLRGTLPADLKARFEGWLGKVGDDPSDQYDSYLAIVAAQFLHEDFRKKFRLNGKLADSVIADLADDADVDARPIAVYKVMELIDELQSLSPDIERQCMKDGLDDLDTLAIHAEPTARAWAVGDIAGVKAHYSLRSFEHCAEQMKTYSGDRDQAIADTVKAIQAALTKSGKSFVVMDMALFLRKNGVLDRLGAQGLKIEGPPG